MCLRQPREYNSGNMTLDQQSILAAYNDAIKKLFVTLFEQYAEANGDAAQEQQAEQRYAAGIGFARRARDRAVTLAG